MMAREDLKSEIHLEILNLRALEYVLNSEEFHNLYSACSHRQEIDFYLERRDVEAIKFWMHAQRISDLTQYNIKQLRLMGQRLRVRDYHLLSKNQLIVEIHKCSKRLDCTN